MCLKYSLEIEKKHQTYILLFQSILLSKELEAGLQVLRTEDYHIYSGAQKSHFCAAGWMEKAATEMCYAKGTKTEVCLHSMLKSEDSRKTGRHILKLVPIWWFPCAVSHLWGHGPMWKRRVLTLCCSRHSHPSGPVLTLDRTQFLNGPHHNSNEN